MNILFDQLNRHYFRTPGKSQEVPGPTSFGTQHNSKSFRIWKFEKFRQNGNCSFETNWWKYVVSSIFNFKWTLKDPAICDTCQKTSYGSYIVSQKGILLGICGLATIVNFTPKKHKIGKIWWFQVTLNGINSPHTHPT